MPLADGAGSLSAEAFLVDGGTVHLLTDRTGDPKGPTRHPSDRTGDPKGPTRHPSDRTCDLKGPTRHPSERTGDRKVRHVTRPSGPMTRKLPLGTSNR
jgi:hypothetical protein